MRYTGNSFDTFSNVMACVSQWYLTFLVCVPPDAISLQLCTPKLLVYNSTYTQSIIYIQNKLNKLHSKYTPVANPESDPDYSVFVTKYLHEEELYDLCSSPSNYIAQV
jgi:hypothetical protein